MAVTLFTDRRMLDHRVPARHPERPERLQAILRHLERTGYLASLSQRPGARGDRPTSWGGFIRPNTCTGDELEAAGGGMLDPDTWVFPGSNLAAQLAARRLHRGGLVCSGRNRPTGALPGPAAGPPCAAGRGDGILHLRQCRPGRGRSHRPL